MSSKRRRAKGTGSALNATMGEGKMSVFHMDAVDVTRARMPRYDGFVCRGGVHGDTRYNRRKFKEETRRIVEGR